MVFGGGGGDMDGGSGIGAKRKGRRRHHERRLLHPALSSAQRLVHHARDDAILHGHARRVEYGEPAVPVVTDAAPSVQRPPVGQLSDLDDVADVDEAAPHGVPELAPLRGLEPAVGDEQVGRRDERVVQLLLPGRVAPHARDVQRAAARAVRPGPRTPQQRRPRARGRDDETARVEEVVGVPDRTDVPSLRGHVLDELPDVGFRPPPDQRPPAVRDAPQVPELMPRLRSRAHHPHRRPRRCRTTVAEEVRREQSRRGGARGGGAQLCEESAVEEYRHECAGGLGVQLDVAGIGGERTSTGRDLDDVVGRRRDVSRFDARLGGILALAAVAAAAPASFERRHGRGPHRLDGRGVEVAARERDEPVEDGIDEAGRESVRGDDLLDFG